jgi:hypothetical protein
VSRENGVGQVVCVELLQCIGYVLCGAWVLRMWYMCILWGAGHCKFQIYSILLASC